MSDTELIPIGFILIKTSSRWNLKKHTFEPYTTGEFLKYPEHWLPVYKKPDPNNERYYIQNKEAGYLGNAPIFWGKDRRGYTAYLDSAHKFTFDEAQGICLQNPKKNVAWNCKYIDKLALKVVDTQHLDSTRIIKFITKNQ